MYRWDINYAHKVIKKCEKCIRIQKIFRQGKWVSICASGWDPQTEWKYSDCKYIISSNNSLPESN